MTIYAPPLAKRHGCSVEQIEQLQAVGREMRATGASLNQTPIGAFGGQRTRARARGVGWELSLWQWWTIWKQSGRWAERGRDGYVMCRRGDEGPYAVGNVYIHTSYHNRTVSKNKLSNQPVGVSLRVRMNRMVYIAHRTVTTGGKTKYLGTFPTPDAAHQAYLNARSA